MRHLASEVADYWKRYDALNAGNSAYFAPRSAEAVAL